MTTVLINLLLIFVVVTITRGLGPPLWVAIWTGRMPGLGRPYTRRDTPFRFYFVVLGSIGLIAGFIGLTLIVLSMSVRDLLVNRVALVRAQDPEALVVMSSCSVRHNAPCSLQNVFATCSRRFC
jgi:hypothetical protein